MYTTNPIPGGFHYSTTLLIATGVFLWPVPSIIVSGLQVTAYQASERDMLPVLHGKQKVVDGLNPQFVSSFLHCRLIGGNIAYDLPFTIWLLLKNRYPGKMRGLFNRPLPFALIGKHNQLINKHIGHRRIR